MKPRIYLCLFFLLLIAFGCGTSLDSLETDFVLKVSGTPGLKFEGNYSFPNAGLSARPTTVEGKVPVEYQGKGITAVCVFRKIDQSGSLKVEILRGSSIVATKETTAPYGVVTLGELPDSGSIINRIINKLMELVRIQGVRLPPETKGIMPPE